MTPFAGIIRSEVQKLDGMMRSVLQTILIECNHTDNPDFLFDGKRFPLKRGMWVTSWKTISARTGFSVQQIRSVCGKLKNLEILTNQSTDILTNRALLINVIAIDKYLIKQTESTDQVTNQITDGQQTPNRLPTTNNKDNNNNKENNNNIYMPVSNETGKVEIKKKKSITQTPKPSVSKFKYTLTALRQDITDVLGKKFRVRKSDVEPSSQDKKDAAALKQRLNEGVERQDFRNLLFNIKRDNNHKDSGYKWITTEFVTRSDMFEKWVEAGNGEPKKSDPKPAVIQKPRIDEREPTTEEIVAKREIDRKARHATYRKLIIDGKAKGKISQYHLRLCEMAKIDISDIVSIEELPQYLANEVVQS